MQVTVTEGIPIVLDTENYPSQHIKSPKIERFWYPFLVYTKTVDSVFRPLWLATQTRDTQCYSKCYSLIHVQLLRASDAAKLGSPSAAVKVS